MDMIGRGTFLAVRYFYREEFWTGFRDYWILGHFLVEGLQLGVGLWGVC